MMINLQVATTAVTHSLYETSPEPEIKDNLETTQSPFEEHETIIMSVGKRKYKDRLKETSYDEDPDIAAAQRKHGYEKVRIIQ